MDLEQRAPIIGREYPWEPRFHEVEPGVRMAYVDEGEGRPVLLLHGNPTWGFLYRKFVRPLLADGCRVVIPDHIGFGRSDKPTDPERYRLARRIDDLVALVEALDLHGLVLLGQDWGGPIGFGMAVRLPERIAGLVVANTWVFPAHEGARLEPTLVQYRTPGLGEILVLAENAFVEANVPGWSRPGVITPEILDAYRAPFPDYWSRIATLANPRDIPVGEHPSAPVMQAVADDLHRLSGRPMEIIWGLRDRAIPPALIRPWLAAFPDAHVTERPDDGHYIQEDAPEAVIEAIRRVLGKLGGSTTPAQGGAARSTGSQPAGEPGAPGTPDRTPMAG